MLTTKELTQGQRVRLISFGQTHVHYRRRLLALGVTQGVEVEVIRIAPLGCPIQINVRGTALALRKEEACYLQWESL